MHRLLRHSLGAALVIYKPGSQITISLPVVFMATTKPQADSTRLSRLSEHPNMMTKHLAVTFITTLSVLVLFAACANGDGSTSPPVAQEVVNSEVVEQVDAEGVFLRVVAPLDEARGYCLDIPGHMAGVRLERPLQVHTCKHGIWNQDGRFDVVALRNGVLRMPHYDLCVQAANNSKGAKLLLTQCTQAELQTWTLQDSGEIALAASPLCISVEDGPGRDAGGPRYLMKGVGLDDCEQHSSDRQQWTTVIPR